MSVLTAASGDMLFRALDGHLPAAVTLRRALHANPRPSGQEADTLIALLEAIGLSGRRTSQGGAVLRIGDPQGAAIALRTELDALPIVEQTGVSWSATGPVMHACGHDVHMAALYAVSRTLDECGAPVPLVLALQPREEALPSGAKDLLDDPALTEHDIQGFLGVHIQPRIPQGHYSAVPGPVNAAADEIYIEVTGNPGHAAYPHVTADPVVAAAALIGSLQHLVSRRVNPMNPTVLTIGSIAGGSSPNVIAQSVLLTGTLRTFDEADRLRLSILIEDTASGVAAIHGCVASVRVDFGEPVLDNDPALAAAAPAWLEQAGLCEAPPLRSCGADDFSYYCARYPSLMVFVGTGTGSPDEPGLHHPQFLPSDETVGEVARAMLAAYLGAVSLQQKATLSPEEALS
jgi:amidohydrolase